MSQQTQTPRRRPSLARTGAVLITAMSLVLGGCAQIPMDGKVTSQDISVPDPGPIYLTAASGPAKDASPQEIVEGFVSVQAAGLADDWKVAREYLTDDAAARWQPTGQTTVFSGELHLNQVSVDTQGNAIVPEIANPSQEATESGEPSQEPVPEESTGNGESGGNGESNGVPDSNDGGPEQEDPGSSDQDPTQAPPVDKDPDRTLVQGSVAVIATLDDSGIYTEALPDAQSKLNFMLVRNSAGQWRISSVANGYYISQPNFQSQFRPIAVYFLSADHKFLVPEVRWFWRNRVETYAINSLLAGPSPWLQDAVSTAIPAGTRLVYDSVSVDSFGTAHINLSAEVLGASAQDRKNLTSQVNATLMRLPGVRAVEIQVSSVEVQQGPNEDLLRDPMLASSPVVVSADQVYRLSGRTAELVPSFGSLKGLDITGLALGESQDWGVLRLGTDTLATIPTPDQEPQVLLEGSGLLSPSIDRFGWVWSGESESVSQLRSVQVDGTEATIAAPWLAERTLIDLRVSHDGSRVAIISGQGDQTQIEVAAVIRDQSGVPLSLSTPITVGSALTNSSLMQWLDETSLAVIARSESSDLDSLFTVMVGGRSEMISNVAGAVSMGAGRGLRSLFIGTDTGEILSRTSTGASWGIVMQDSALPTFPG